MYLLIDTQYNEDVLSIELYSQMLTERYDDYFCSPEVGHQEE